jgi:hypothetical protein
MYFRAQNGTFKRVPQMGNQYLEKQKGGLTVYYIPPYDGKSKTTAFRPVRGHNYRKVYIGLTAVTGLPYAHGRSRPSAKAISPQRVDVPMLREELGWQSSSAGYGLRYTRVPEEGMPRWTSDQYLLPNVGIILYCLMWIQLT